MYKKTFKSICSKISAKEIMNKGKKPCTWSDRKGSFLGRRSNSDMRSFLLTGRAMWQTAASGIGRLHHSGGSAFPIWKQRLDTRNRLPLTCKKTAAKSIRRSIGKQLGYLVRNLGHMNMIERYEYRIGYYPGQSRLLQRTRNPSLRPRYRATRRNEQPDKKHDYLDQCERMEVERRYSLAKRKSGLGLINA